MRLEGQAKSGFYPLPPRWIDPIAEAIRCKTSSTLFDPCCGKGDAVKALGNSLCIPPKNVYGSEMDEGRSAEAVGKLAEGRFFGPVDFLGSAASGLASIVYVNPPFDNELGGGGRVEWRFLMKSIECCIPGAARYAWISQCQFHFPLRQSMQPGTIHSWTYQKCAPYLRLRLMEVRAVQEL